MELAELRRDYTRAGLQESDVAADPLAQFKIWFQQALDAKVPEPNAMTLCTVDQEGQPSGRIVLLKGLDERGFMFFTNYESSKGRELAGNPKASLVFFWPELERQVRVQGTCSKLGRAEAETYFRSRPLGSRLSAHVSRQSSTIAGRAYLEQRLEEVKQMYPGEEVPLPEYWGGYALQPHTLEFWQGRPSRLHDRLRYTGGGTGGWSLARLSP
jgi:pyridoxamine 5'-phosphate oxidase